MPKKEELRKKDVLKFSKKLKQTYSNEFAESIGEQRIFKSDFAIKNKEFLIYHTANLEPLVFEHDGELIPTLYSIRKFPNLLPTITVDAGAVKFMINGADLYRPGMVEWDTFDVGQYVTVINLQKAAMCIGKTTQSSAELPDKGKITKTIHHLNDAIWNFAST